VTQLVVPAAGPRAARAARAGLRDYGRLPEYYQAVRRHPGWPWTRQQFLDAVLPNGLLFSPGDSWASNVGYMLVVDVLGRVTGRTFAQVSLNS
jgi:CubicO group peptidase (beta-lactamase class C family)